jgi:hypothetical protein
LPYLELDQGDHLALNNYLNLSEQDDQDAPGVPKMITLIIFKQKQQLKKTPFDHLAPALF